MAYARSYTWDPLGNRIQQYDSGALTTGTFNAANQLTLITPASGPTTICSYDASGNSIQQNSGGVLTTQTWSPDPRHDVA
jgi:YD repeat-containing protein